VEQHSVPAWRSSFYALRSEHHQLRNTHYKENCTEQLIPIFADTRQTENRGALIKADSILQSDWKEERNTNNCLNYTFIEWVPNLVTPVGMEKRLLLSSLLLLLLLLLLLFQESVTANPLLRGRSTFTCGHN
jgi:hypothetical protein